jgi:putative oxidoreductase
VVPIAPAALQLGHMSSHFFSHEVGVGSIRHSELYAGALRWLAPVGRLLFAAIFILSVPGHFSAKEIAAAGAAGVPVPELAVPVSGIIALVGGLSVLLGYRTRIGALLIAIFLIPVTLMMHRFWAAPAAEAQMQMAHFMKNVALLGTTCLIGYFGAGPISLDERQARTVPRWRAMFSR